MPVSYVQCPRAASRSYSRRTYTTSHCLVGMLMDLLFHYSGTGTIFGEICSQVFEAGHFFQLLTVHGVVCTCVVLDAQLTLIFDFSALTLLPYAPGL
ncbi:hypothetical protein DPMN_082525 [Dreissena polymorpha]|uniref:Uncharacterized protein n=1 Tax=Dreissena polymorpha TaxID=45954 RepID=A0A9D3YB44_DREPO|nr:hypothetical protein DPMN_082525 [Dreissena polymorpha]